MIDPFILHTQVYCRENLMQLPGWRKMPHIETKKIFGRGRGGPEPDVCCFSLVELSCDRKAGWDYNSDFFLNLISSPRWSWFFFALHHQKGPSNPIIRTSLGLKAEGFPHPWHSYNGLGVPRRKSVRYPPAWNTFGLKSSLSLLKCIFDHDIMSDAKEADIHGTMFFANGTRKRKKEKLGMILQHLGVGASRLQVTGLFACTLS